MLQKVGQVLVAILAGIAILVIADQVTGAIERKRLRTAAAKTAAAVAEAGGDMELANAA